MKWFMSFLCFVVTTRFFFFFFKAYRRASSKKKSSAVKCCKKYFAFILSNGALPVLLVAANQWRFSFLTYISMCRAADCFCLMKLCECKKGRRESSFRVLWLRRAILMWRASSGSAGVSPRSTATTRLLFCCCHQPHQSEARSHQPAQVVIPWGGVCVCGTFSSQRLNSP